MYAFIQFTNIGFLSDGNGLSEQNFPKDFIFPSFAKNNNNLRLSNLSICDYHKFMYRSKQESQQGNN